MLGLGGDEAWACNFSGGATFGHLGALPWQHLGRRELGDVCLLWQITPKPSSLKEQWTFTVAHSFSGPGAQEGPCWVVWAQGLSQGCGQVGSQGHSHLGLSWGYRICFQVAPGWQATVLATVQVPPGRASPGGLTECPHDLAVSWLSPEQKTQERARCKPQHVLGPNLGSDTQSFLQYPIPRGRGLHRLPISPHLCKRLLLSDFLTIAIVVDVK